MFHAPTESAAMQSGQTRLSANDLRELMLGNTGRGLYRGGFRFICFTDLDGSTEGRNHYGTHDLGVCTFDDEANTMTVTWRNGWDETTTRAYRVGDEVQFFDADTGLWRQTFSAFVPGRESLHLR